MVLAVAIVVATLPATASAAASRAELEERVLQLERAVENQGLLELARQVEQLQAELRALRGSVEELQYRLDGARGQQREQYLDLDRRLQALEEGAARAAAAAVPPAGDPEAEYRAAFELMKAGQYAEARAGFGSFLAAHPEHELASNAQYWLGEAHYVELSFDAALAAFERVISAYPGARKAPDAMLKAAYSQYELKRYEAARSTLTRLIREYPDTPAAREAGERLARMTAEGR